MELLLSVKPTKINRLSDTYMTADIQVLYMLTTFWAFFNHQIYYFRSLCYKQRHVENENVHTMYHSPVIQLKWLYWKYSASACQCSSDDCLFKNKQVFSEVAHSSKGDWIEERAMEILDSRLQKSCKWTNSFISVFLYAATVLFCKIYVIMTIWLPCVDITSNIQLLFQCIFNSIHALQAQNHIINTSINENKHFN